MLLLIVLLAQAVQPSDESHVPRGDIAGLLELWEELNSACRKLPPDSREGEFACRRRDVVGVQLGQQGWCFSYTGLAIKWEMCPRR